MSENKKDNMNIGQFLKFVAFSCSAGLIQIGSFTLMSEVLIKLSFFQGLMQSNATFAKIMENEYGPMYLIAGISRLTASLPLNRQIMFRLQCSRFSAIILYSHRSLPFWAIISRRNLPHLRL